MAALTFSLALCGRVEGAAVVPGATCPAGTDFELAGYTVRTAHVESPFSFLRWIRAEIDAAERGVARLTGQPYRNAEVLSTADELERLQFLPDAIDQRVRVSLVVVSVTNCSDKQLDLVYSVFSSQIAPVLSGTFESGRAEKAAPERVAGADDVAGRLRLSPGGGYDRSERLFGGGRVEYRLPGARSSLVPLDTIVAEGRGSESMHEFSAALAGSTDTATGWLAHADWQLNYLNTSEPTDESQLRQNRVAAQLTAITRPLGEWQVPVRFGGLLEGGRIESDVRGAALPPDSVRSAGYGSSRLYAGTTTRLDRNVLAVSYGIELGSIGPNARVDWIKHIGDLAHEVTLPVGDHRSLTMESRLTAGLLQVPGAVPVPTRFFGGNREDAFIPGNTWTIRSNPVIRSIAANRFDRTAEGPGGTRFIAYNMTAAIPIWRKPVVPFELSRDAEFRSLLDTQIGSATSLVQTDYAAKDPHFKLAAARVGDARAALARLKAAVDAAEAARPGQSGELFKACVREIGRAERRMKAAAESKDGQQLGDVAALLSVDPDEDRLGKVHAACVDELNARIGDAAVAAHGSTLEQIHADMERQFSLIDQASASRQARGEMAYVKRTLNTLVTELNIVSVSPVVMFDVAHLGPASSQLGTRYGIGGGLRVTLANSVDFTVGYLVNPKRMPRESSGAFFFSMQFKDLFE